jgi:hypothetical protein
MSAPWKVNPPDFSPDLPSAFHPDEPLTGGEKIFRGTNTKNDSGTFILPFRFRVNDKI